MTRRAQALPLTLILLQAFLLTTASRPSNPSTPLPIVTADTVLNRAEQIALLVLANNQRGDAHLAASFYAAPWIRDSYAWGMVPDDAGTLSTFATSELRYWLARQQPFGGWITDKYSGWYDETAIVIAAVLDAYRLTGDLSVVRQSLPALRRGWRWLDGTYTDPRHGSLCLLWAAVSPHGRHLATDWADQVARQGYTPQLEGLWYRATHAMAALEWLVGATAASGLYSHQASCIADDVNRLLWKVTPPAHLNAQPLPAFGHYRAWPTGRNYFEVDGNALLVASGLAASGRETSVLKAIAAQSSHLLGGNGAGPARVLYGDYAPQDYGPIHNWMAAGRYQSAYWPTVGGLLAMASARDNSTTMSISVLRGLATRGANVDGAFNEWYGDDGLPGGAAFYTWGARMYLLALYRAYLGVDDTSSISHPADLVLRAIPGPGRGELVRLGRHITIVNHGRGALAYARLDGRFLRSSLIPAGMLYSGAVLDVFHQN